jgi:hypothetical protein
MNLMYNFKENLGFKWNLSIWFFYYC